MSVDRLKFPILTRCQHAIAVDGIAAVAVAVAAAIYFLRRPKQLGPESASLVLPGVSCLLREVEVEVEAGRFH